MSAIDDLKATMARLRAPDGCPWDQEQTHASLVRCLIDEVSELIDTIDRNDYPHMREELGDVLIQVVFHAQIAAEQGLFDFDDVARDINDKLIRRHPHVFGTGKLGDFGAGDRRVGEDQGDGEEARSARERLEGVQGSPAAVAGADVCGGHLETDRKEAAAGRWRRRRARVEALGRRLDEASLGKMLFELTAAARAKGLDPEGALRLHATKVMREIEAKTLANVPLANP